MTKYSERASGSRATEDLISVSPANSCQNGCRSLPLYAPQCSFAPKPAPRLNRLNFHKLFALATLPGSVSSRLGALSTPATSTNFLHNQCLAKRQDAHRRAPLAIFEPLKSHRSRVVNCVCRLHRHTACRVAGRVSIRCCCTQVGTRAVRWHAANGVGLLGNRTVRRLLNTP